MIEFLRSRERAAFEAWRGTAWNDPDLHARDRAWKNALAALNAELNHRVRVAQ